VITSSLRVKPRASASEILVGPPLAGRVRGSLVPTRRVPVHRHAPVGPRSSRLERLFTCERTFSTLGDISVACSRTSLVGSSIPLRFRQGEANSIVRFAVVNPVSQKFSLPQNLGLTPQSAGHLSANASRSHQQAPEKIALPSAQTAVNSEWDFQRSAAFLLASHGSCTAAHPSERS
jgi:hypothetical protein